MAGDFTKHSTSQLSKVFEVTASIVVNEAVPRIESWLILKTPNGLDVLIKAVHTVSESEATSQDRFVIDFRLILEHLATGEYPIYLWLGTCPNTPFDVVDVLLPPLIVESAKARIDCGHLTTGCFNVPYESMTLETSDVIVGSHEH